MEHDSLQTECTSCYHIEVLMYCKYWHVKC